MVELGRPAIEVDGREVRPRIAKSVALLAYLAAAPGQEAERSELLDALFGGRADDSARSYLRQAVYRLREVLPEGVGPAFDGGTLRFGGPVSLSGDAARAESLLAEASRLQGEERLAVLLDALALLDRGEYLEGVDAPWVAERREHLGGLRADARLDAARLAYEAGRYTEAGELGGGRARRGPVPRERVAAADADRGHRRRRGRRHRGVPRVRRRPGHAGRPAVGRDPEPAREPPSANRRFRPR